MKLSPHDAVIIDALRTPIGRAHAEKGVFRHIRADDLAAAVVRGLLARTGLDPREVEDCLFGCTQQIGEQGFNLGRMVALLSGMPVESCGATVNRLCGSSLQALHQAVHSIRAGAEDVHIVGGVEHMQHYPMEQGLDPNPALFHRTSRTAFHMGWTAEQLARVYSISRAEQDAFALRSHQRAIAALDRGDFDAELCPANGHDEAGAKVVVQHDQCPRRDSSLAALAALPPAFLASGAVTAGNCSPLNDGAAALLVMSAAKAESLGLRPLARVAATAVAGVSPAEMGIGPVPASRKALARAGLPLDAIDLIELNEAFAVQALACVRLAGFELERVNSQGGAIALGHPLGASGARLATTLVHQLKRKGAQFGLATMCIGMGQGIATVFENLA